jgi:predicted Rossmann-fold nucleotide-binding protein
VIPNTIYFVHRGWTDGDSSMSKLLTPRRIGVCGSSRGLPRAAVGFCEAVGRRLAREPSIQIVTGGTKCRRTALPGDYATDWLVASAASKVVDSESVATTIATIAKDEEDSGRFMIGAHERARGRTSEARRIAFVRAVDALIAVAGRAGTEQELALAMEFGLPVLPVPTFGGASAAFWLAYRPELINALRIDEATASEWETQKSANAAGLVDQMIDKLVQSLSRRCFVIMPFDPAFDPLFDHVIAPAVAKSGDHVIRVDRLGTAGDASTHVRDGIRNCDYVIAVLEKLRPNVMYELGLAHGLQKPSILLRSTADDTPPPFDIYTHQRLPYGHPDEALQKELQGRIAALFPG